MENKHIACGCGQQEKEREHESCHGHAHCHEHEHEHGHEDCGHGHACGCGHCDNHEHADLKIGKFRLIYAQIALSAVLLALSFFFGEERVFAADNAKLWLCLAAYLVIGTEILWNSARSIGHGKIFDENFLMAVASVGAFAIGDFPEAVGVMLFYRIGELFQDMAVERSRKNIKSLLDLRPDFANVLREGGAVRVSPEEVAPGEIILVKAGERVPLDGVLVSGHTTVDHSALTGESLPRELVQGEEVLSGSINLSGTVEIRVTRVFAESTVAKILDMVENASAKKSRSENFITKFAKYYTPAVVAGAVLLAVVPCLFVGFSHFAEWGYRALTFLVISCPCALVISVPLSFFGGIGGASRMGVLIKGSHNVEELARAEIVVFDKTGTLTKGNFAVAKVSPAPGTEEAELLRVAAAAESVSNHPIAKSIVKASETAPLSDVSDAQELSGYGISAIFEGERVLCGNAKLLEREKIAFSACTEPGTAVYVARGGKFLGSILIADEIKPDSREAVAGLRAAGVKKTVMLTGDAPEVAEAVGRALGIDEVYAGLLPQDKVARVEALLAEKSEKGKLLFAGDGINDAPVIARADVGIAMGGMGSDAAIEVADVVLMTDEPSKLAKGIRQSRRTMRIVKENIVFALGVKAVILVLGALGFASMWLAVFADVGVSFLAILNALRALRVRKKR